MLVIKNKADIKISYPIEKFDKKENILFFDIETTGFSRQYCNVYLIGCMYYCEEELMYCQWMAENFNDEANVLMSFHKFIQRFKTIIHFNGNSFDMPFLQERGEKYKLDFDFEKYNSIDIYKPLSKLNHILKMENQKQKTFEKLLGIERKDPFTGGDLVEVFKHYVESKDDRLIYPLLLHNLEDVLNMGTLTSLLAISDFFDYKFLVEKYVFTEFTNINQDNETELVISLNLENTLPTSLSYNNGFINLLAKDNLAKISVKVKNGTYKYFFDNYSDYYYLPMEDKAIHKSVASFVDKDYRKKATAATCYENFTGSYLPIFCKENDIFKLKFREDYKSKDFFIKLESINDDNIFDYTKNIIHFLKEKPKK